MSLASSPEFLALQELLPAAQAVNRPGSAVPHVSVIVPSFNLTPTVLAHYGPLLPALEHRYLLPVVMLGRIPGCEFVLITSTHPGEEVLDYYADLASPRDPDDVKRRIHIAEVPDRSPRGVAEKLLERPGLLKELKDRIGGRPAILEPWNVSENEVRLAIELGVPLNGTSPDLWHLGFKSAGRRLFREAGVPVPAGVEGVHDSRQVAIGVDAIRSLRPELEKVVVKQDDSVAGDGNFIVVTRRDGLDVPVDELAVHCLDGAPDWFAADLESGGGVVEEMVLGARVSSPSCQIDIAPDGSVTVISTHEQVLGGENGQVYTGCSFPAYAAYAGELAEHSLAVGKELAEAGALGRAGVDFVTSRRDHGWLVAALEINLRRGGTTHPYAVLRHLVPGQYDAAEGVYRADDGAVRCYRSSDGLKEAAWTGMSASDAIGAIGAAGLSFDRATRTGVVLHMLDGLLVDGRIGVTAIAQDDTEAKRLYDATAAALHAKGQESSSA
jgi:hypothetical protein